MSSIVKPYYIVDVLLASKNQYKVCELTSVAQRFGIVVVTPDEAQAKHCLSAAPEVAETGKSFRDNALLKAKAFVKWSGMVSLGDDSGLEVEALGNEPGVNSARYAGPGADDAARIKKLLHALEGIENRKATYVCSLTLAYPNGAVLYSDFSLAGRILDNPRGEGGFGYDPVFYVDEFGGTFAEADFQTICTKGFRAQAGARLFETLVKLNKPKS